MEELEGGEKKNRSEKKSVHSTLIITYSLKEAPMVRLNYGI